MGLEEYREEIDRINKEIADLVSQRMEVVKDIGRYKEQNNLDVVDKDREEKVKQQFEKLFAQKDLPREKGRELAILLIEMAVQEEK